MARPAPPDRAIVAADVRRALAEDLGHEAGEDFAGGDPSAGLIPAQQHATAELVTRDDGMLCGSAWFAASFHALDAGCRIAFAAADGEPVHAGQRLATVEGNARALLAAERTALNFLQTLSGTATAARRLVTLVEQLVPRPRAMLLDTRKTLPGLRYAQKYATRIGGFQNHRMGLYDRVLLKENHLLAAGSIAAAVGTLRRDEPAKWIEVEVENEAQLAEAVEAGANRALLDNFPLADLAAVVARWHGRIELEVSGGVDAANLATIAQTGVDYISIGAVTKHLKALDLSLRHLE